MKKIIVFIFFVFSSSISIAHMAHYNNFNKIEMEIFRNGNLIGYNHYFFNKSGNNTTVTNEIKFKVKLLGKTIFQVEGFGEEKYYFLPRAHETKARKGSRATRAKTADSRAKVIFPIPK